MATFVRTQTISHPVGERGRVGIKVTSGDVQINAVAGGEAVIRATYEIRAASEADADRIYEEIRLRVRQSRGELLVEEPDSATSLGQVISRLFTSSGHADLTIEADLPAGVTLSMSGVSAEVRASGLRGEQKYATVSGDLSLSEAGGTLRINTVSGDADIRAGEPLGVEAEAVSGDLSISAPLLDDLRATTVSGDVELEGELAARGGFSIETVSGDLSVGLLGSATFEIRGLSTDVRSDLDHRIEGSADRRRLIIGSGGPALTFRSMSGDVAVRRPRRARPLGEPLPPLAPLPPVPPLPVEPTGPAPAADAQLEILRALERGEIDVDEATRRLAGGH
jgi:hypothetical protein